MRVNASTNERILWQVDAAAPGFWSVGKLARKLSGASAKDESTKKVERAIRLLVENGSLMLQRRPNTKRTAKFLYAGSMETAVRPEVYAQAGAGGTRDARMGAATDPERDLIEEEVDAMPWVVVDHPFPKNVGEDERTWCRRWYETWRAEGRLLDVPLDVRRLAYPKHFGTAGGDRTIDSGRRRATQDQMQAWLREKTGSGW
jgi:hypothetical protein